MTERVDQRICIKFCLKRGHSSAETVPMIKKAFGDDSMSEAQIKLWYKRFKDESWVYGYDPETKAQSSQWKSPESPRPKKARQSRSNVKVMLTVFSNMKVLFTISTLLQARQ